ncbi:DUF2815 family protein [candidate division KSB1 bacterium]|nr:DUF2815 family protein [candidate division KSB1 bacterium]
MANLKKGKMITSTKFRTPEFRVSFPHLFEPHGFENEDPCYSVNALFPQSANLKCFDKAVRAVIDEKLGGKKSKKLQITELKDGDEIETKDGEPRPETQGKTVIRLKSKNRKPRLLDSARDDITNPDEIYGGCYGVAVVEAYLWKNSFGIGVTFGLLGFQKTRDGEPFLGGVDVDDFEDVEEFEDDDDQDGDYF